MERVLGKREAKKCQNIKRVCILLLYGLISRKNRVKIMQFNNTLEFVGCGKINGATKRFDQSKIKIFHATKNRIDF